MMNPKVISVIIPVYKVEKYLDECLKSVVGQTYPNLDIILVDDGSPDRCPEMCEEWARKDSRIRVIHKENAGLGEARNTGIEYAKGQYLFFLDSDDYLAENAIEILYNAAEEAGADIVGSGTYFVDDEGNTRTDSIPQEYKVYRGKEILDRFLPNIIAPDPVTKESVGFGMCISGSFFSRRIICNNNWKCASEREIISEDVYSFLNLIDSANCAVALPVYTYYYRENPQSLSRTYRPNRYEENKKFYYACQRLAEEKGYGSLIRERLAFPFISHLIGDLKLIIHSNDPQRMKIAKEILNDVELRRIIADYDMRGENSKRRLLLTCIKYRLTQIALLMIWLKA